MTKYCLGWPISFMTWASWRRRCLSRWMWSTRRSCEGQWPIRSLAEASRWPMRGSCFRFSSQGWVSNWDHSAPSVWLTAYVIRILEAASFQVKIIMLILFFDKNIIRVPCDFIEKTFLLIHVLFRIGRITSTLTPQYLALPSCGFSTIKVKR